MRARILDLLSTMFDKADSRSSLERHLYKKYADRSIRYTPVFKPGDSVFLLRPPTQAKIQNDKEDYTAQSKLCFKTVGPFQVVESTPDTVTILEDGIRLKFSIDPCVRVPGPEDEARQEEPSPDTTSLPFETQCPATDQS